MLLALLPILLIAALVLFWLYMFNDMLHNDDIPDAALPVLNWPPAAKNQWMVFFFVLNIFTAGFYYLTVYRQQ